MKSCWQGQGCWIPLTSVRTRMQSTQKKYALCGRIKALGAEEAGFSMAEGKALIDDLVQMSKLWLALRFLCGTSQLISDMSYVGPSRVI